MLRLLSIFLATSIVICCLLLFCLSEFSFVKNKLQSDKQTSIRFHRLKDKLKIKHKGEPFDKWPEIDRLLYVAINHGLYDLGESATDDNE